MPSPADEEDLDREQSPGLHPIDTDHVDTSQPGHADTGTAAGVGGVTGAAIGAVAGPIGAAVGALGGMLLGAAAERVMHADDDKAAANHTAQTVDTHPETREPQPDTRDPAP